MEIKIVDDVKGEGYNTYIRRYSNSQQFVDHLKEYAKRGCKIMYLHDIDARNETIIIKTDENGNVIETRDQVVLYVRADYKGK